MSKKTSTPVVSGSILDDVLRCLENRKPEKASDKPRAYPTTSKGSVAGSAVQKDTNSVAVSAVMSDEGWIKVLKRDNIPVLDENNEMIIDGKVLNLLHGTDKQESVYFEPLDCHVKMSVIIDCRVTMDSLVKSAGAEKVGQYLRKLKKQVSVPRGYVQSDTLNKAREAWRRANKGDDLVEKANTETVTVQATEATTSEDLLVNMLKDIVPK